MRANKAMQLTGRRIEPVPDWGGRRPPRSARFAGGRRAVRGTFTGGRQLIAGPLGGPQEGAKMLHLVAYYPDSTAEARISPTDDPSGMFVAGHFLEVRWPSPGTAVLNVEGRDVEVHKGGSSEFRFIGIRVQATHS